MESKSTQTDFNKWINTYVNKHYKIIIPALVVIAVFITPFIYYTNDDHKAATAFVEEAYDVANKYAQGKNVNMYTYLSTAFKNEAKTNPGLLAVSMQYATKGGKLDKVKVFEVKDTDRKDSLVVYLRAVYKSGRSVDTFSPVVKEKDSWKLGLVAVN